MATSNFTITLPVSKTPREVFDAINNIRGWWTEDFEGNSQKLNDEFTVRFFEDIHVSTQKLIEVVPDKKIVWLVTKSKLNFLQDPNEWTGTKISFEITGNENKSDSHQTQIHFNHLGLVPGIECYKDCSKGWNYYIKESLFKSLTEGKGKPEAKSSK